MLFALARRHFWALSRSSSAAAMSKGLPADCSCAHCRRHSTRPSIVLSRSYVGITDQHSSASRAMNRAEMKQGPFRPAGALRSFVMQHSPPKPARTLRSIQHLLRKCRAHELCGATATARFAHRTPARNIRDRTSAMTCMAPDSAANPKRGQCVDGVPQWPLRRIRMGRPVRSGSRLRCRSMLVAYRMPISGRAGTAPALEPQEPAGLVHGIGGLTARPSGRDPCSLELFLRDRPWRELTIRCDLV